MPKWLNYLSDAIRQPREELSRRQHQLRYGWDVTVYCGRQLARHRAEGMAAELTYRTIFSLIPVVVLALVMFRVVGGLDDVQATVENQLYSFFGVPEIPTEYLQEQVEEVKQESEQKSKDEIAKVLADEDGDDPPTPLVTHPPLETPADSAEGIIPDFSGRANPEEKVDEALVEAVAKKAGDAATAMEARASIRRTLHQVTSQIASLNFASIGVAGLVLFLYAAVALADSTEYLFNIIYEAPSQRPIHLRLAIHWSIITLGSGLLAFSLYLSGEFVDWFGAMGVGSSPTWLLRHLLSFIASWVLLFLLYSMMPNTHVSLRAAAIGSAVGAVLWEVAKFGFQIYVSKAVPYSALYGSLGLIPLFLFWIYVTWLIVLFGLVLTYTTQTMRGRRLRRNFIEPDAIPAGDPDWMLPIMTEVAMAFDRGDVIGRQELADQLGLSSRVVHDLENQLISGGCLRRVPGDDQDDHLTLGRPAEKILIADILRLAHQSRPMSAHPAWKALVNLKLAERNAAGDQTLADVINR